MAENSKPTLRRGNVLKKLNTESLQVIERGLLGDLPDRLKPNRAPVRGRPLDLIVAKPSSFLSCLPTIPASPISEKYPSSDDEDKGSPLKKSFSFRDKFSRISFLGKKDKEKVKWKTIVEDEKNTDPCLDKETKASKDINETDKTENDLKSSKRFWLFRNKELAEKKESPRTYMRSKSFEFLPRAIEEEPDKVISPKKLVKNSLSYVFGSSDTIADDVWTSNESLEYPSNVCYNDDDGVFLKSIKDLSKEAKDSNNSSLSTTSGSSGIVVNIMERGSVQNILQEFDKAVELFTENYMSDSEPYTKTEKTELNMNRKSSSFSTLPSARVLQAAKVSEVSEKFKNELSKRISDRRIKSLGGMSPRSVRRGSVTDWFVLEDQASVVGVDDKYRKAQRKPTNRVRRMSSTKYWITPEECAVYSREQRPPLVIPRITQYRPVQRNAPIAYKEESPQESVKSSVRQYDRLQDWSPGSERSFKEDSDSPPFTRLNKRFGGSTENLLITNARRPAHLQLPNSSSGDSLDVEVRERPTGQRNRKSRSMLAPKHRIRSPVPAPRMLVHQTPGVTVLLEGPVKRTKFSENGKKSRKNWVDCYMTLTPTALVFYKDQKTYYATKQPRPAGTPPSPTAPRAELVLPLQHAHIMHCIQMHTRRYTRSLVLTVGYDQYLLQDETEEGAKRWLMAIQNVYYKLGPPRLDETPHPVQYQSSNTDLESLGRTPPVSRHSNRSNQKGGSSNEDLSDSTEVSIPKSHVKRRLRNFFAKRPTMDSLVKKGIYQEEPVFGRKLEEVCPGSSPRVPEFVVACVKEIESSEENMTTDGLYRASGNLSQVQKIRLEVDQNNLSVLENSADIHVLTGSLKLFFRELKEPLIPCTLFDRVLAACSIKPREAKIKEFRDIIHSLPQCNRDTLKFLLEHLLRVTQYSERNRMHTANLAIVFGPTLLWAPAEQAHNIAIDCIQQNHVVEILLNEYKEIFEENGKGKKKT